MASYNCSTETASGEHQSSDGAVSTADTTTRNAGPEPTAHRAPDPSTTQWNTGPEPTTDTSTGNAGQLPATSHQRAAGSSSRVKNLLCEESGEESNKNRKSKRLRFALKNLTLLCEESDEESGKESDEFGKPWSQETLIACRLLKDEIAEKKKQLDWEEKNVDEAIALIEEEFRRKEEEESRPWKKIEEEDGWRLEEEDVSMKEPSEKSSSYSTTSSGASSANFLQVHPPRAVPPQAVPPQDEQAAPGRRRHSEEGAMCDREAISFIRPPPGEGWMCTACGRVYCRTCRRRVYCNGCRAFHCMPCCGTCDEEGEE